MNVIDDLRARGLCGRIEFYGDHFVISVDAGHYSITKSFTAPAVGYVLRELAKLGDEVLANQKAGKSEGAPR